MIAFVTVFNLYWLFIKNWLYYTNVLLCWIKKKLRNTRKNKAYYLIIVKQEKPITLIKMYLINDES